ncbi:hypothetical protein [Corynebacterium alimapuense]|uniref:Uncharacterized protein n=1 Tax=Corynebacterium alimapuense TaxID=1576874 RepID=A0A3M8K8G2_9CORY|nr:hypothetical protein [Corynebacterium alimapuense]RNE49055.1 hypothetical protein C5L39_05865 [Corynebacterium alimapuense]
MIRTGVLKAWEGGDLSGLPKGERIALLRARMAGLGGEGEDRDMRTGELSDVIAVPPELGNLLENGGVVRRAVTEVANCPALVVELIAHATSGGGRVGIVGWPELSLAGVIEHGRLDRVVVIPDPGADRLGTLGVLVEGLDLVIAYWSSPVALSPVHIRPLLGKLRGGLAALVIVGATVSAPAVRITASVSSYHGIGAGVGRIHGIEITVGVTERGHRPGTATVLVGRGPQPRALKLV